MQKNLPRSLSFLQFLNADRPLTGSAGRNGKACCGNDQTPKTVFLCWPYSSQAAFVSQCRRRAKQKQGVQGPEKTIVTQKRDIQVSFSLSANWWDIPDRSISAQPSAVERAAAGATDPQSCCPLLAGDCRTLEHWDRFATRPKSLRDRPDRSRPAIMRQWCLILDRCVPGHENRSAAAKTTDRRLCWRP